MGRTDISRADILSHRAERRLRAMVVGLTGDRIRQRQLSRHEGTFGRIARPSAPTVERGGDADGLIGVIVRFRAARGAGAVVGAFVDHQ